MGLRLEAVHVVPFWEEDDGTRRPGMRAEADHPPVVGWENVLVLDLDGERHELLPADIEESGLT